MGVRVDDLCSRREAARGSVSSVLPRAAPGRARSPRTIMTRSVSEARYPRHMPEGVLLQAESVAQPDMLVAAASSRATRSSTSSSTAGGCSWSAVSRSGAPAAESGADEVWSYRPRPHRAVRERPRPSRDRTRARAARRAARRPRRGGRARLVPARDRRAPARRRHRRADRRRPLRAAAPAKDAQRSRRSARSRCWSRTRWGSSGSASPACSDRSATARCATRAAAHLGAGARRGALVLGRERPRGRAARSSPAAPRRPSRTSSARARCGRARRSSATSSRAACARATTAT